VKAAESLGQQALARQEPPPPVYFPRLADEARLPDAEELPADPAALSPELAACAAHSVHRLAWRCGKDHIWS
jgi:hypothetical protein